jgi:protein tyrosine/serine phosphatase
VTVVRDLVWDGCSNVRDLGGHSTADGGETRFGAVVRSDTRAHLTDAGWEALLAYGVSRIVDLRRDEELADDPPREVDVEVVHESLMAGLGEDASWVAMMAEAEALTDERDQYVLFYGWALEHRAAAIARALAAVASAPPGAVVVHCVGGKDRTGLVAALLLRLCGVSLEDVDADYALTEQRLRPRLGEIATAPAGAMATVLERLEGRHGSVEAYLVAAGLAPGAVDALRARLCG